MQGARDFRESRAPLRNFAWAYFVARELVNGQVCGWFRGRFEFGPRALGARSIIADPRRAEMKDKLNATIKFREPFRPFCPSILAEATGTYFETDYPSPFMVQAYRIRAEQQENIPAVTHEDGTGRLQTVSAATKPAVFVDGASGTTTNAC